MDILTWVCGEGAGLQWPRMTPLGRCCAVCQHSFYLYVSVFVPYVQTWASLASCIDENTETSQTESWKDSFRNQITVGSDRVSCQCRFAFIPQVCWPNDGIKWPITGRRPSRHEHRLDFKSELLLVIQSVSLCDGYAQSWAASMASSLRINNLWDSVCICSYYITTL